MTKGRGKKPDRVKERVVRVSLARRSLDAWVREQRGTFEGDKANGLKWYTEKTTAKQLWDQYQRSCRTANVPTVGTQRLLHMVWKSHKEIVEVKLALQPALSSSLVAGHHCPAASFPPRPTQLIAPS